MSDYTIILAGNNLKRALDALIQTIETLDQGPLGCASENMKAVAAAIYDCNRVRREWGEAVDKMRADEENGSRSTGPAGPAA